jgi:hypothetical protein
MRRLKGIFSLVDMHLIWGCTGSFGRFFEEHGEGEQARGVERRLGSLRDVGCELEVDGPEEVRVGQGWRVHS